MLGADSLFIIIWLELPIIWHYMLKAAGLQIRRISISTVTLLFFYLFQYVGLPIYYFNLDKYRLIELEGEGIERIRLMSHKILED